MLSTSDCLQGACPISHVLDLIDGKWSILLLRELFCGDRRTHELSKALTGISSKTLSHELKRLEKYGLLDRRVYAEVPPRVEYSLTPKGREIQPVLRALYEVGRQWLDQDSCDCPMC
ncbi:winged helix-turn-helix transcriptional regulator [Lyngbya confervoides]|uniref:Helix-turn-helix transcriptional regulator n=1 Tax=Lyngbya confervoides BDU141951 TaxID=1574623 RepID=A0ABD4T176_9CYAN|nr:helix-turn-helix domain-containing protein [Lyngbya confervoides]MCM1982238.1 helix-turn-helix transcriptional regulator [Lyngbya confervoides BDU141951]